MPAQAGGTSWTWVVLCAALLVPGLARAEMSRPEVVGSLGGTFAVLGTPSGGGSSVSLALLWPVQRGVRFGVMVHGDDAGSTVDSLRDVHGVGLPYGKIEQFHRAAWGASWRLDLEARSWLGFVPYASGTWGYYRIADDVRGDERDHAGSAGFSLAAGARHALGRHFTMGAYARYHRLFNDLEPRFVSAGFEGSWR